MAVSSAFAIDLGDFPQIFAEEVRIIVGKSAAAEDVVGAIDIVSALQQRACGFKKIESAVLDTEINKVEDKNSIVVGGPCINSAAARLMGYPTNCMEGFEMGKTGCPRLAASYKSEGYSQGDRTPLPIDPQRPFARECR